MKLAVGFILYEDSTARYLADFLPSLDQSLGFLSPEECWIFIHDNSEKGEENRLAIKEWNSRRLAAGLPEVEYISAGENLGFSRAYNVLIRRAAVYGADYFLVINPDTVLEPDAIRLLAASLEADGSLGSVAPQLCRWDFAGHKKTGMIDSLGIGLAPGLKFYDIGQGEERGDNFPASILGPSGAAGLFRMSALMRISFVGRDGRPQFFDESFFMYKEDCDLAYRLFLTGHGCRLVPGALIYHDRSAAAAGRGWLGAWRSRTGKSRTVRAWSFRNQHLIYLKFWSKQDNAGKMSIVKNVVIFFVFSLLFEQFLLKEYPRIYNLSRGLTNT